MEFIPHDYQSYCIDRAIADPVLGLFLAPGLGKTVISLTVADLLKYDLLQANKFLVIAPKKVAETTWVKEAEKWDHLQHLRLSRVLGGVSKRIKALNAKADIYVINRENVEWLVDYYRNDWPFDVVFVDELSSFKNHRAKRTRALVRVRKKIKRIYGLTGTPAANGLMDLWSQLYLLDMGERLGKHIGQYRERYFVPDKRNQYQVFSYAPKPGAEEAIYKAIGDICISMSAKDYLKLPGSLPPIPHWVALDTKARAAYDRLERELLLQVDDHTINASTAAVLNTKLLQLCNGAVYDDSRNVVEIHNCKIEALLELVEEMCGQPVIIYYHYKHDLTRIKRALLKTGLRVREMLTPADEDDWNAKKIDVLLAHPQSVAYGLNLQQGGNQIIWFGPTYSLEQFIQANDRLDRQGQLLKVLIHILLVEDSMDEAVMSSMERKDSDQNKLLDALKVRLHKVRLDQMAS